jgi:hypothetical protein
MKKKTVKTPDSKNNEKIRRERLRTIAEPADESKLVFQEIRNDFVKLRKSRHGMQLLWYRAKKEHDAFMNNLEKRVEEIKKNRSNYASDIG